MPESFFITTAIDYTNGAPHIGHAYEKVLADVIARYRRLRGDNVFFLTGVDQHGQKVQQSADKMGVDPQQFVDEITGKFLALWEKLGIRYDRWAATTDPLHKRCVQGILQRLFDEGQLYRSNQGGYYSVRQEQFLTDKERGPDGEFGPEWGEVEFREEENYYFKLAQHKEWLLDFVDTRERFVTPAYRQGELRNAVERLSGDLCVSRPKSRLAWGIELPFDPEFVTFVWFDALVNYISFADYDFKPEVRNQKFFSFWPALHVIGKDIMIPAHGVYWPIMLKALGFTDDQIPRLLVHGWWNIGGEKMSKSLGNIVDPNLLADKYGAEAVRYYLVSDIATGKDSDFSEARLRQRYNTDLANSLGNLLNRTLNMTQRYRDGRLRMVSASSETLHAANGAFEATGGTVRLGELADQILPGAVSAYEKAMGGFEVHLALLHAINTAVYCNGLIECAAPWKMAKEKDQISQARLDAVLYHLAESLRIIAILISPVLPRAARGIFDQLGIEGDCRFEDTRWGLLKDNHVVNQPVPLFPRIEEPEQ